MGSEVTYFATAIIALAGVITVLWTVHMVEYKNVGKRLDEATASIRGFEKTILQLEHELKVVKADAERTISRLEAEIVELKKQIQELRT